MFSSFRREWQLLAERKGKMEIPKSVELLIKGRQKAAERFLRADLVLSQWCDKHGIVGIESDIHGSVESICNPEESAMRVRDAIRSK